MGQRSRRQGITNVALRAARAASRERDEVASQLAQRVYNVAVELKGERDALGVAYPVVQAAAEMVAPAAAQLAGLDPRDEALVADVAAYLVSGFREMTVMLKVEHFNAWRRATDEGVAEQRQLQEGESSGSDE